MNKPEAIFALIAFPAPTTGMDVLSLHFQNQGVLWSSRLQTSAFDVVKNCVAVDTP